MMTALTAAQQALAAAHAPRIEARAKERRWRDLEWDERVSAAGWGLCIAARDWDGECLFTAFADLCMRRAIGERAKWLRRRPLQFLSDDTLSRNTLDESQDPAELIDRRDQIESVLGEFPRLLTPYQARALCLGLAGLTHRQIAERIGRGRSAAAARGRTAVTDACRRAVERLRTEMTR